MNMDERRDGPDDRRHHRKRHHIEAIPDKNEHPWKYRKLQLRWRLAVATAAYPVQAALAVALLVCVVPVVMLIGAQGDLHKQQHQIQQLVGRIQTSRHDVTHDLCQQLDRNARTANAQLKLFQSIIISGATSSRIFDGLYRQYGGPPFNSRVKTARKTAAQIGHLKLPLPNCTRALRSVGGFSEGKVSR